MRHERCLYAYFTIFKTLLYCPCSLCTFHPFLGWITPGVCEAYLRWPAVSLSLGRRVWPNGTVWLVVRCTSPGVLGALGKGFSCLTFHDLCTLCDICCLARPSTLVVHVPHWGPTWDGVVSTGQFSFFFPLSCQITQLSLEVIKFQFYFLEKKG